MNDYRQTRCAQGFSGVSFTIEHNEDEYDAFHAAAEVSDRFLRSAALLPDGEHLGFQTELCRFAHIVYADSTAPISVEDFEWMFSSCAKVSVGTECVDGLYAENRKVYALSWADRRKSARDGEEWLERYDDSRPSIKLMNELFQMLADADAWFRIIACGVAGAREGYGRVLISLPDGMTLRMRSLLSIAFPHTVAVEIGDPSDEENGRPCLLNSALLSITKRIIYALICGPNRQEESGTPQDDQSRDAHDAAPDTEAAGDGKPFTPIEELDLYVRSYSCLKRAGITSVEKLKTLSADDLMRVRNIGRKNVEEILEKLSMFQKSQKKAPKPSCNYGAMLDELIGQQNVKEQLRKIAAFARMKRDRAEAGGGSLDMALNMGFVGHAGTAKTTVARIAAGLFREIGLLQSDEIVEVGRADLIAKYVGHTAIKVQEVFKRAKGKLLFIDEAYSLLDGRRGGFGDEAISTIVQEMENHRHETIVIFAGYPSEMEAFFAANAGLRSRVPFIINFSDYSCDEMTQIVELEAKKKGFAIDGKAEAKIHQICSAAVGDPEAGNGRFCRNLLESAILSYAVRAYGNDLSTAANPTLIAEDFPSPETTGKAQKPTIGFCA